MRFLEKMLLSQCVLLPAADDAAIWLAELPAKLRDRYSVSSSSGKTLRDLQDKSTFAHLTSTLDIPAPFSLSIQSEDDIERIPFDEARAIFLKPVDSQAFVGRYNKKALWVENIDDAHTKWLHIHSDGLAVIAQEYVPGGADDHYFIDGFRCRDGVVRAKMARRRLRIYPPDFGNSSYCESVAFNKVAAAWWGLERLLEHTNYRGIFSAEFKKDSETGEFRILEINTRPWVYVEFAGACGLNMCELYIRDALEQTLETLDQYSIGNGCVSLYNDLVTVIEMPASRRPKLFRVLWQWARSFKLLFAWRDPWPATVFIGRTLRRKIRKAMAR